VAYLNLSAYKFVALPEHAVLEERAAALRALGEALGLGGTVLIAPEGINLFACATPEALQALCEHVDTQVGCGALDYKRSLSPERSFKRWKVKVKDEIITYHQPRVRPQDGRAPSVEPHTLAQWITQGHDDAGRELVLLDTRNEFEVLAGKFAQAHSLGINKFTELPQALQPQAVQWHDKRVVAYCTGGIRCEKAVLTMQQAGLEHAVQLEGGILRYFEHVGAEHWLGELFVFDERLTIDHELGAQS
jgi:UPF0176 protein